MSVREWKALPKGGLALLNDSGDAVDSLTYCWESMQYKNAAGVILGRKWEDARDECIARNESPRKIGKRAKAT